MRRGRACGLGAATLTCIAVVGMGCLDRPVAPATPQVSARVVAEVKQNKVSKIDLLFMIDNSSSMADKQNILKDAVPDLVKSLIEPKCVDADGKVVGDAVMNQCKVGVLDFEPIKDIHIGIISSSLGSHGAPGVCDDASDTTRTFPHNNDRGHLISRAEMDGTIPTWTNKGFLLYNPSVSDGLKTADAVVAPFKSMVTGVGQQGCGYEASLESVYRFLVDPEPYLTIRNSDAIGGAGSVTLEGVDQELLAQRAAFLRPDSLVSVMIVTDENDCSIVDGGQGFYPLLSYGPGPNAGASQVGRGTAACLTNPNDHCCFNCGLQNPPSDCTSPKDDVECLKGARTINDDPANLRCFNQKQKYGASFLYPVQRYIDGFRNAKVPNRKREMVDNPLFSDLGCKGNSCQGARDPKLVFVAGITGVPWQLIAKNPQSLVDGYKSADDLAKENLWDSLVGQPDNASGPIPPSDPHMVESITPRKGLPGPSSPAKMDPINGHEWDPSKAPSPSADLQYACTFTLPTSRTCKIDDTDCDCAAEQTQLDGMKNPLCQDGNTFTMTQVGAKAYPGTRILQMLQGLEPSQAIVASICPANTLTPGSVDYGYTPAIQALISRLRVQLRGRCLPHPLEIDPDDGTVKCVVVETYDSHGKCDCSGPARRKADPQVVTDAMRDIGDCYCEIDQIKDMKAQDLCKTSADPGSAAGNGWCYVDPSHDKDGNPDPRQCGIVSKCQATERRLIKFVNQASEPQSGATAFIMCQEKAFDQILDRAADDVCKATN